MRILIILENYFPRIGGVETFFKSLVDKLDEEGHQVVVLTNRYHKDLNPHEQVGNNTTIIRKKYYNRYLFTFGAWFAALKYAKQADLIHTTSYNAAVPAWVAAKITRTKSIITFHERWGDLWYQLPWMSYPIKVLHKAFEAWITKLGFDKFVAVSDFTKNSLIKGGVPLEKVVRIYNGIRYEGFPSHEEVQKEETFTFMFYGRVGHAKGLDILLKGYKMLLEQTSNHKLLLVLPSEKTPLFSSVQDLIQELELTNHIEIKHDLPYSELTFQIARVNAIVIPSYSEGFCFAAAETMAIGTPIISSGLGALAEVVSGRHVTLKSHTAAAMAEALKAGLDQQWIYKEETKFHLSTTIDSYLSLYKELNQY